jgi:hypothetical protein
LDGIFDAPLRVKSETPSRDAGRQSAVLDGDVAVFSKRRNALAYAIANIV